MDMRHTRPLMIAALVLLPARLWAQDVAIAPTDGEQSPNFVDFGLRGTSFASDSDEARFQRSRDLRNGPTLDLFRYAKQTDSRWFTAQADHVGYRDQRYAASYNNYGKVKVFFEWNQVPLFYSQDTATL